MTWRVVARACPVDQSGATATRAVVQRFLITRGVPSGGALSSPAISGNLVVWMQTKNGGGIARGDIYGKNLATGRVFSVTSGRTVLSNPAISDAMVVWLACRSCSMTRDAMGYITYHNTPVYAKDLSTGQTRRIVTLKNAQPSFPPTIRGRSVLWWEISHSRYTEYGQDLVTGRVLPLTHPAQCGRHAALLSANTVVWLNTRAGQPRLYGTDLGMGRTFPLVISRSTLRHARDVKASNHIVIWTDWDANRAQQPASIYGKDLTTGRKFHVTTIPYGRFNPQLGPPTAVMGGMRCSW